MIYFARFMKIGYIKIGTTIDVDSRLPALRRTYGDFDVLGYMSGDASVEAELHQRFAHIKAAYNKEFFLPADELTDFIRQNATMEYDKAARMVTVQVDDDVHAALGILKKRYGLTKMGDALREFFRETDADLVTAGQMLVRVQTRAAGASTPDSTGDAE